MFRPTRRLVYLALFLVCLVAALPARAADPVVRAVLFYSPSCPHCHQVIDNDLPPLAEQYGEQLDVLGINTAHPDGQTLYQAAITHFAIPPERRGVPTLIVGETVLVGSGEIPQQFPGLIEQHLAAGGVDWPAIPGLADILPAEEEAASTESATAPPAIEDETAAVEPAVPPAATAAEEPAAATSELDDIGAALETETVAGRFRRDVTGNSLAVIVLVGMVVAVVASFRSAPAASPPAWQRRAIPLLIVAGLLVAAYMTFVETTGTEAVCGPVGDCNTVQHSRYATLLGFLPIGVLGLIGYAAMGLAWLAAARGRLPYTPLVFMAFAGTLFSIYLTFLEPFVIGATCLWCLSSAVIITAIMLLALRQAPPAETRPARPA